MEVDKDVSMGSTTDKVTALIVGNQGLVCQSIIHILRDSGALDVNGVTFADLSHNPAQDVDVAVCVVEPETPVELIEASVMQLREALPAAKAACLFLEDNDVSMAA